MPIEVKGRLSLDGSGWEAAIHKAEHEVEHLSKEGLATLKGQILEAFSIGAIEEFARRTIEYGAQIKHSAEQFELTTDEVQKLSIAAEHLGLQFTDVATAIDKIGKLRKEAGEHEGDALKEMEKWGISLENIRDPAMRNIDLLSKMQEKVEELGHTAEGRQELRDFFGRGGGRMVAVLEELKKASPIKLVDPEDVKQLDEVEKHLQDIWTNLKNFGAKGVAAFLDEDDSDDAFVHAVFGKKDKKTGNNSSGETNQAIADKSYGTMPDKEVLISPPIFPYKPNKELLEELAKAERRNHLEGLTNEQKILELTKERAEVLAKIKTDHGDDILKEKIKATDIDTQIKGLESKHTNLGFKTSNSLISTGNFLGASDRQIVSVGERTNHLLQKIVNNTTPKSGGSNGNLNGSIFAVN
jgi:hypothetical protein